MSVTCSAPAPHCVRQAFSWVIGVQVRPPSGVASTAVQLTPEQPGVVAKAQPG
jgi:hypothetical protein